MENENCILRLSRYKNSLLKFKRLGLMRVFSENLADAVGVTAAQVRKDFSIFGIRGNRRGGYQVDQLIMQIRKILGKDKVHNFILVGTGNLGKALLRYPGFEKSVFKYLPLLISTQPKWKAKQISLRCPLRSLKNILTRIRSNLELSAYPTLRHSKSARS